MKTVTLIPLFLVALFNLAQTDVKNAQVFPKDITRDEIKKHMFAWSGDLGVRCSFCHWSPTGKFKDIEYESDKKETKQTARDMFKMMTEINESFFKLREQKLSCYTCHHGTNDPRKLEDILADSLRDGGLEAMEKTYRKTRKDYHGQGAYNFGPWAGLYKIAGDLFTNEDVEGAKAVHELNLEFNPDYDGSHSALGAYYLRTQFNLEKARVHFQKSMAGNSFWTPRRLKKHALQFQEEDQDDKWKATLDLLIEIAPEYADGHYLMGLFQKNAGNLEDARLSFQTALELKPGHKGAQKELAGN